MDKLDYKKAFKELYQPPAKPSLIDVPEMIFIAVDGKGDPNTCAEYKAAIELLYGLSFTIKMSKLSDARPAGYFEYVVPPLEGLWSVDGGLLNVHRSISCFIIFGFGLDVQCRPDFGKLPVKGSQV